MTNEPMPLRDRLLDAQQMSPALRAEYRTELGAIVNHRLTPQSRLLVWCCLIASLGTMLLCIRSLFVHPQEGVVLVTFATAFFATALWMGWALWQGKFSRRSSFAMVEYVGGTAAGIYVGVVMFRAMHAPSEPNSVIGMIMAVLLVMCGFAWGTGNRIAASTLETREHLLRMESRLADLADQFNRKQ